MKGSCIVFNNSTSVMIFGSKFSNSEASEVMIFNKKKKLNRKKYKKGGCLFFGSNNQDVQVKESNFEYNSANEVKKNISKNKNWKNSIKNKKRKEE